MTSAPVVTPRVARDAAASIGDRVVLVTGGTGFLGHALVSRLLALGPAAVRILSQSEVRRSQVEQLFRGSAVPLEFVSGDVADPFIARQAVDGVHIVFHLAAMKYVNFCEQQPYQAVKTNIVGSKNLIDAAVSVPTLERFIAVSTDKASNPVGVYGMTKALVERIVCDAQAQSGAVFTVVRCGNFWGSTASVVPIWLRIAREGRDIEVTDPDMTRFVMLAEEGVDLVLEATVTDGPGQILARVMPSYLLADLAQVFRERFGVATRVVGMRLGEKLHEDLIARTEAPFTRREEDRFIITPWRPTLHPVGPFSSADASRLSTKELDQLLNAEGITV